MLSLFLWGLVIGFAEGVCLWMVEQLAFQSYGYR